jgi:hypothetical protein
VARRFLPSILFLAIALSAIGAIRSYDLFWQLATGRWIVEHHALPASDPFAVASDKGPWIDGEWLYEVALYGAHSLVGLRGLSILRGLLAGAIFTIAFFAAKRESEPHIALLVSTIGFAGAMPMLDLRPSGVAALMLVLMLTARSLVAQIITTIVWMNVHPSALLAPFIAGPRRFVFCALALLANPYGWNAILAPIRLTAFVRSGQFVNAEWLPSPPLQFPILYLAIAFAVLVIATSKAQKDWWRIAILALFAFLAVRHVRNQPLFFAAFPILIAPHVKLERRTIAYAVSAAAIVIAAIGVDHRLGVPHERFPIEAVARLQSTGLRGNIYNPDQFGGYLIWSFYPERRALTDGRNELYRTFIPEWQASRADSRKWSALLRKYDIDLAVDEYHPPLRVIDGVTGKPTMMDASLAFWPRSQWALIGYDEAGMVFARRAAFPGIGKWEVSSPVRGDS